MNDRFIDARLIFPIIIAEHGHSHGGGKSHGHSHGGGHGHSHSHGGSGGHGHSHLQHGHSHHAQLTSVDDNENDAAYRLTVRYFMPFF